MPGYHADRFAEVARLLATERTVDDTLRSIVTQAAETISGAEHAAITVKRGSDQYRTVAFTADFAVKVDQIQYDTDEGPCLTALHTVHVTQSSDVAADPRWPHFGPEAKRATGVVSMLSSPLYLEDDNVIGALNMYATRPNAFDDADASTIAVLSTHGAIAFSLVADRQAKDNLTAALASSRKIGAAIGILMHKHHLSEQQAFDALRIASQHSHRKLIDIAYEVVDTGQLTLPPR
jgi:transcriptional regulator with GAF, ATPase, and Fis domain